MVIHFVRRRQSQLCQRLLLHTSVFCPLAMDAVVVATNEQIQTQQSVLVRLVGDEHVDLVQFLPKEPG